MFLAGEFTIYKTVSATYARRNFLRILEDVQKGTGYLITWRGKPLANILPQIEGQQPMGPIVSNNGSDQSGSYARLDASQRSVTCTGSPLRAA